MIQDHASEPQTGLAVWIMSKQVGKLIRTISIDKRISIAYSWKQCGKGREVLIISKVSFCSNVFKYSFAADTIKCVYRREGELQLWSRRFARKPTLWTLRKVSIRISLSMPRRLTRTDIFRLLWIFCFRNHYYIPLFPGTECVGPD